MLELLTIMLGLNVYGITYTYLFSTILRWQINAMAERKTFAIAFAAAAKCSHNFWQQPSQNNKLASAMPRH